MKGLLAHPAKLIFLGVLALMLAANHAFLFDTPWHENGDFAVNALQIDRARHFNEVYGNYSRFHFNHPGPAFFYAYALGEFFFLDWLQIVPSPHNAHALTGVLLQAFFFTAAIVVAGGWIRYRWFLPLVLLLGGAHFGLAGNAFISIWPPHVLVMPFLCFLVAGASTAAGRARHLPLTVLSACFLVHGHVAQALFVLLLFPLAYGLFLARSRLPGQTVRELVRQHRAAHLLAGLCLVLFVLPLGIDLASGAASNLVSIVRFLHAGNEPPKSLTQSLAYLLSFFAYFHHQDQFLPALGPGHPGFIWTRAAWYPAWLAAVALVVFTLIRLRSEERSRPECRFLFALATLTAVGLAITIPWGVIQTGPMFEFNGHFYYALVFALLMLVAAAVARLLPERGVLPIGAILCAGGAAALWHGNRTPDSAVSADSSWVEATQAALRADPQPNATKYLVFSHDDWGDVARTALALKRAGGSYRVDGNWSFMFGRYRTFRPAPPDFGLQGMSVWRFSHRQLPGRSVALAKDFNVYFDPVPLNPAHFVIDCSRGGNLEDFSLFGFNTPDGDFSWTNLPDAALQFSAPRTARDILFSLKAEPFVATGRIRSQPMALTVNGRKIAAFDLDRLQTLTARIPAEVWNLRPVITVVLSFPKAESPLHLALSTDPRLLGWAVHQMTFDQAEP
ncbi:MAG: hypothetical protein HY302_14360 [Opitutae bacterium]|nr:hypothetical protein [Opitutae bacterium]